MKYELAFVAVLCLLVPSVRAAEPLSGSVQRLTPRIARPDKPAVLRKGTANSDALIHSGVDVSLFKLNTDQSSASTGGELDFGSSLGLLQGGGGAATLRSSASIALPPRASGGAGAGTPAANDEAQRNKPILPKPIVVIHITGFKEDPDNTPVINYDALKMAKNLQLSTKAEAVVILFLDRNGVRLATRGYDEPYIDQTPVHFHKLINEFVGRGGRIILSKPWASKLCIQQCDLHAGAEILTESEIADVILDADRIIDYSTPPVAAKAIRGE